MKYNKLSGTFGCFDGSIEFKDGLNIIYAGNESGKSTTCALIRGTLYGISSAEREKKGMLPDKIKYLPWSGKPMYGRLELTYRGRNITITRETTRGGPLRGFSAVFSETNQPVGFLDASNAGEQLTGVSQEVFMQSAFCSARSLAVFGSYELEKKIAAIAGTGDENISVSAVDDILGRWQRERKFHNTGKIPDIERKLSSVASQIAEVESINAEMLRVRCEKDELQQKKNELSERLSRAEAIIAGKKQKRIMQVKNELERDSKALEELKASEDLHGARADREYVEESLRILKSLDVRGVERDNAEADYLRALSGVEEFVIPDELKIFENCEPDYALEKANNDYAKCKDLLETKPKLWILLLSCLLAAGGAGILFVNLADKLMRTVFSVMSFAAAAAAAAWGIFEIKKASKRRKQGEEIYKNYSAAKPEGIVTCAAQYSGFYNELKLRKNISEQKKKALESAEISLALISGSAAERISALRIPKGENPVKYTEKLREKIERLLALQSKTELASASIAGFKEAYDLEELEEAPLEEEESGVELNPEEERKALSETENEIYEKEMEYERLRGRLSRFEDIAGLKLKLAELNEQKDALWEQYHAISAAKQALAKSSEEISCRLTPALADRAEEIFSRLTGKKYKTLLLTKDFDAEVIPSGEVAARRLLFLSDGAYDQLYLALRIALSEVMYTQELPPLVLDDVLSNFDDDRAKRALEFFAELAKTRQIIMFTCREREIITGQRLNINIISKQS